MKAIFRTKKGSLLIEDIRDIPMPAQVWRVAVPPELTAKIIADGETPDEPITLSEIIYTRIGEASDGTPIYENS